MSDIFVNDQGISLYFDYQEDISSATNPAIHVLKPDGTTTASWTPSITGTSQLKYTLGSADLASAGDYKLQCYIEMGTYKGHSSVIVLNVKSLYATS